MVLDFEQRWLTLPRRRDLRVHHVERQRDRAHRVDVTSPRCPTARQGQSTHRHDVWRTATTSVLAAVRSLSPGRWEAAARLRVELAAGVALYRVLTVKHTGGRTLVAVDGGRARMLVLRESLADTRRRDVVL
jgi:hypothetical protein